MKVSEGMKTGGRVTGSKLAKARLSKDRRVVMSNDAVKEEESGV